MIEKAQYYGSSEHGAHCISTLGPLSYLFLEVISENYAPLTESSIGRLRSNVYGAEE